MFTQISSVLVRSHSGCIHSTGAAGLAGQDGAEGPEPPPVGAVLLHFIPGGSVVPAQWQPWTRARLSQAASGPEGRPAPGLHTSGINSVFPISRFITKCCGSFQSSRSDQHVHIGSTSIATRKNNEGTFTTVLRAPVKTAPGALLLDIWAHLCRRDDRNHRTLMDALTEPTLVWWACGNKYDSTFSQVQRLLRTVGVADPLQPHNGCYYYDCITVIASVLHLCSCRFGSSCIRVVKQRMAAKGFIYLINLAWYNATSCQNYPEMQSQVACFESYDKSWKDFFFPWQKPFYMWAFSPAYLLALLLWNSWPGPLVSNWDFSILLTDEQHCHSLS